MRPCQVLSDCPNCKVESALLELVDPHGRVGVALSARCRLCAYATELGDVVRLGDPFVLPEDVIEALGRWAAEEGEPDVGVFVAANFSGGGPAHVAARVLAGERVETSFDVIAHLFPGTMGGRGAAAAQDEGPRLPKVGAAQRTASTSTQPKIAAPADPAPDPRDIGRALASVMLADGRIRKAERAFLDRTLAELGAPPLPDADLRVWRPTELGPVANPARVLEAMRLLALVDHEADGSEARVLREFARAWGLRLPKEPLPRPTAMAALGRALAALAAF